MVQYVVVVERGLDSGRRVQGVVREMGARARLASLARLSASPVLPSANAAVVGLRPGARDAAALDLIARLRSSGVAVVAHCRGSKAWPLSQQCEPLLAGAIQLLDSGASDFDADLRAVVGRCLAADAAKHQEHERAAALGRALGIVGASAALLKLLASSRRLAQLSDVPVLIEGETGTGKELLAQALHRLDPRRSEGPFVPVNCAAISRELAESELFGHRRGAFTGADRTRKGWFRAAQGGVLFLDEVGELDLDVQAKLLRVLQEGRVLGVGEDREEAIDVRVIAATHRDLTALVQVGRFRADLLFRLNAIVMQLPPLRERPEDVAPLVEHFLEKHSGLCAHVPRAAPEFLDAMRQFRLEGNVRQLENMIREVLLRKDDAAPLGLADLPASLIRDLHATPQPSPETVPRETAPGAAPADPAWAPAAPVDSDSDALLSMFERSEWRFEDCMDRFERVLIGAALRRAQGNQSRAARLLGVTPRTIYNKLRKHGLAV